jgi:SAM-dependent methyltransferase
MQACTTPCADSKPEAFSGPENLGKQPRANTMDAHSYHAIATGPFAPLYPYYAGQILAKAGVTSGCCLDVGCGGGYLGLAVAEMSGLDLYLLDQSAEMVAIAQTNVSERALSGSVEIMQGVVQAIPLPEQSVDLVVSRGSIPFWDNLPTAFSEIHRVLKPGGYACVGGGLGTAEMREAILREMRSHDPQWHAKQRHSIPHHDESHYADALRAAAIPGATVTRGETGTWIEFRK